MRDGYYEDEYGTQSWYQNGKLHRKDGPAVICKNGTQKWYLNGKYHRENGPAYIGTDGIQAWFIKGWFHREDGPAYISSDSSSQWHVNGNNITTEVNNWFEEFNLTYETMEFEDKMALKFFIRGLAT